MDPAATFADYDRAKRRMLRALTELTRKER